MDEFCRRSVCRWKIVISIKRGQQVSDYKRYYNCFSTLMSQKRNPYKYFSDAHPHRPTTKQITRCPRNSYLRPTANREHIQKLRNLILIFNLNLNFFCLRSKIINRETNGQQSNIRVSSYAIKKFNPFFDSKSK